MLSIIICIDHMVEHPFPPFSPQSILKTPRTFLDASTTLNKGERGIFNSQISGFGFVSNYFVNDCSSEETLQDLKARCKNATFVNLSMSTLGLIGKNDSGQNLLDTLTSIGVTKVNATNVIRTAINICIRSTYYLFCRKDKDWLDPDLLIS